ncbi:ankyrin repeat protein [Catovirus CTV1]|uniref:Ankyrin repeat protein n=1 Tax=Catovirus CTV1 TaxID=1977631 RepID=A0A1V0S8F0_9VIRU|nr:ankyrin repeat protein [Catovirus CTV1]
MYDNSTDDFLNHIKIEIILDYLNIHQLNKMVFADLLFTGIYGDEINNLHYLLKLKYHVKLPQDKLLRTAIENGRLDIVKSLIEKGAPLISEKSCYNPLIVAIKCNHFDIVKYLVDKGAPLTYRDPYYDPLNVAIENNNYDIAKYLVENGVSLVSDNSYYNPLNVAIKNNRFHIVNYLIMKGAPLTSEKAYCDPLYIAIKYDRLNILEILVQKAPLSFYDSYPLCVAIEHDRLDIVKYLIAQGVPYISNKLFYDPFSTAIAYDRRSIIKYLIELGSSNDYYLEYLRLEIVCYDTYNVELLVEIFFDEGISLTSYYSRSDPLCVAIKHGHLDIVELLVKKGVDINKEYDYDETTPLMIAVEEGHLDITKYLIEKGCDIDYETIITLAHKYDHNHIVDFLLYVCRKNNIKVDLKSLINNSDDQYW